MKIIRYAGAAIALMLCTHVLQAQQPDSSKSKGMMKDHGMRHMTAAMDSMDARLDPLVVRMNQATGTAKVDAMAQVINELVAERKMMHVHMRQLMRSHAGTSMGAMMDEQPKPGRPAESSQ
jgi:hypothetical protein